MRKLLSTFILFVLSAVAAFAGGSTAPVIPGYYAPGVQTVAVQAQRTTTIVNTSSVLTSAMVASTPPAFAPIVISGPTDITVDPSDTYQQFTGCGAALTSASAYCLETYLTPTQRTAILTELFSPTQDNLTYVRIGVGSTDFRDVTAGYTYDDMPSGQTDTPLTNFSINQDTKWLIPILQQILIINPRVRIMAGIWGPPVWMLTSGSAETNGEIFNTANFTAYANYVVKFIQAYTAAGIPIWGMDVQNEPVGGVWVALSSTDEITFIGTYLGPALAAAGLRPKLLAYDDSWGNVAYPEAVLANATAAQYCQAVGWHGYSAGPGNMNIVHSLYPNAEHYVTEWRSLSSETLFEDLQEWAGGMMVGATRNWAKGVLAWNICLDQNGNGGYTTPFSGRRGLIGIGNGGSDGYNGTGALGSITRNPELYSFLHLTKFLKPGAVRCHSSTYGQAYSSYSVYPSNIVSTAFINPDGSIVLYVYNGTGASASGGAGSATSVKFNIIDARSGQGFPVTMQAGELSTFVWGTSTQLVPAAAVATPSAPTAPVLTATAAAGQINLTWTTPSSTDPLYHYHLYRSTTTGAETTFLEFPVGTNSYSDLLGGALTEFYTMKAVSLDGASPASAEATATSTAAAVPSTPGSVVATSATGGIQLTWAASTTNGSTITGYAIYRGTSTGAESGTPIATSAQGTTAYTDNTVSSGTQYFYKIAAVNATGASTQSSEVNGEIFTAVLDAVSQGFQASGTALTWAHTVGAGSHMILVVEPGYSLNAGEDIDSVTFNGSALTKVTAIDVNSGVSTDRAVAFWYILAPTVGTHNIVTTYHTSGAGVCNAASFSGVNQSTPFRTAVTQAGSANTSTITTTTGAANDTVLGFLHNRTTQTVTAVGTGQTIISGNTQQSNNGCYMSSQPGGTGNIVTTWNWLTGGADNEAAIAVAMIPG